MAMTVDEFTAAYRDNPGAAMARQESESMAAKSAPSQFDSQRQYKAPNAPVTESQFNASDYARNKAINLFDTTNQYASVADAQSAYEKAIKDANMTPYMHYLTAGYSEGINPGSATQQQTTTAQKVTGDKYGSDYVNPKSLASNQAADILSKDSPLLQQALGRANMATNARGLRNSSIGNEAGLSAVTNVATELGKANAAPYMTAQNNSQQGDIASDLSAQNYQQTLGLTGLQADIASQMSQQNAWQQRQLQDLQNSFNQKMTELGYDETRKMAMTTMVNSQTQTLMNQIGQLLNNTDIEMSDSVTNWLTQYQKASWESAAQLLGLNIDVS